MSGQHSILPPSGAPIWGRCALAVQAVAQAPNWETPESLEGTAAHWVGSECLLNGASPYDYLGQKAENGVVVDEKMCEGATVYVNDCQEVQSRFPDAQVAIEQRVAAPMIINRENWGTMDFGLVSMQQCTVVVSDYKHGHGKVDAFENYQLVNYLAGIIEAFNIPIEQWRDWKVEFRVVQPFCYQRGGDVDVWETNILTVRDLFYVLNAKAAEGLSGQPTAVPGAHCRYCPGRTSCTAADRFTSHLIDFCSGPAHLDAVSSSDLAAMRDILKAGELIVKARLEAIDDELEHRVREGDTSAGLALQTKQGRRGYWNKEDRVVIALGKQLGVDLRVSKAVTPKQAGDLMPKDKKELWEKLVKDQNLSYKKSSTQLINADETIAARTFGAK